ncbi:MAG TPA: neuraminidase-like domain-containing protein, partial [Thermoanaerobaculia bacterium]
MATLIILRLHPSDPMAGTDFTAFLNGLSITAFDLTFADSTGGVKLGTASGLANPHLGGTSNNKVIISSTSILQHYVDVIDPLPPPVRRLEAAATAVIVVNAPAGHPEYPNANSFDVRLEITRGGLDIVDRTLEYNVTVQTVSGSLSINQKDYFAMPASAYVTLPKAAVGLDPSLAFVDLPADGQPPGFDSLRKAIDLVLAKDPGGASADLNHLAPLSAAQSRQVAAEMIWNRTLYPPPDPPRSLGEMYTHPRVNPSVNADDAEQDRKKFEVFLNGYQATHEAEALRLAGFVFAASAAVACEQSSAKAERAGLTFPLLTGSPPGGTTIPEASVIFAGTGGLNPPFTVPAAYFYALGATLPPQITAAQRYDMARLATEARLLAEIENAIDAGAIAVPALPAVQPAQAARRLVALGSVTGSAPEIGLAAPLTNIVKDWLGYTGTTADVDTAFWTPEVSAQAKAYLELVLRVVTGNFPALVTAIQGPPLNVSTMAGLVAINDRQWRDFFLGSPALLPPFTQPGTPAERAEAFIRHLRNFFAVPYAPGASAAADVGIAPTLGTSIADVFQRFTAAYSLHGGGTFAFGAPLNAGALAQALGDTFPGDTEAQAWLQQALETLDALFRMTDIGLPELHFSLMEALYARGLTDVASVNALTPADFKEALTGTVAYDHAADIYAKAGATGPAAPPPPGGFKPVNDGSLTDCIPPLHLSPLGPVEYLHELLQASATSTCEDPGTDGEQGTLGALLAGRRGPLGDLHATRANLETPLPLVDLVNESLEALAAGLPGATGGAVYDTAGDQLAGHELKREGHAGHDPRTLFAALPEHSSPATPVAKPAAYDKLRQDFTAPGLPYAQALDVCRSYLRQLGSSRFSAMRHFRKEITELAIDPSQEPADFQRHLWRYPVRFDTALEYLRISQDEYALLYSRDDGVVLRELYGFPADLVDGTPWTDVVVEVPELLARTGLSYCEFLELWRAGFVLFIRENQGDGEGAAVGFPECLPCCPEDLRVRFMQPQDPLVALRELAVFIRLWRRLRELPGPKITFAQLRDICDVLGLFHSGAINPDFPRQLAALLILRADLRLPLNDGQPVAPGATGADRTHLLALWVGPAAARWEWAVALLLDRIEDYAEARHGSLSTGPDFLKLIAGNLDPLSRLAGFDPDTPTDTWHAKPASTLRFVEVLSKLYASDFSVGEILFLFTVGDHLDGDDPFPLPVANESLDDPLELPDDEEHGLWALRRKLLDVHVDEEEAEGWSWHRIESVLLHEFGFAPDLLDDLGEHFFPTVLEHHGHPVDAQKRRYRANLPLAGTSPLMWNTPPDGPFRYDSAGQQLWARLPLRDEAVLAKLSEIRQLRDPEQAAARELYFAPRATLAPFAPVFRNFTEAVDRLVQEPDERERFAWFQRELARFHRRCHAIAGHLAGHVAAATGQEEPEGAGVAFRVLRGLWADENQAKTPWEDDSGKPPAVTWGPQPNGGAFAALLGLAGTGLLGELSVDGKAVWREVRGPLSAFGHERDEHNAPFPCVLPSMGLTLTAEQQRFAAVRNGFALRDVNGEPLGGAQPFRARWSGVLLVEHGGRYRFHAGAPTPGEEEPDFEAAEEHRWRVTLRRGQKTWFLLNHHWPGEEAPAAHSAPLALRKGAYQITVELEQREPAFARAEDVCPRHCGFQIKYTGPDSEDRLAAIPLDKLFRDLKDGTLDAGFDREGSAASFLHHHFTSTLRDVRRTYQRAFKAVLFAHRFRLSAKPVPGDRQSELGFLLDHGAGFAGTSYFRAGAGFQTHHADFDFNFLPVSDPYRPPAPAQDQRAQPSAQRRAALFDLWERTFDYTVLRRETRPARERPAWLLFYEAAERQPDDPAQLLRHLGVDIRHAPLVLRYFAAPPQEIASSDLEDERWPVRVWQAEKWLRGLQKHFAPKWIGAARPDLWAADDPGVPIPGAGNENLTRLVADGDFENGEPRRYERIKQLDDGLRERARAALLAYLRGMDRVALPWGAGLHAKVPRDLSDLLLQDVETGICELASRIEDAVRAVQAFVQRARLGLEPSFVVTPAFARLWDRRFATFRIWEACKRREIYRENWIDWDELRATRQTEAFRFLESELRRATLTVAAPGGLEWWPAQPLPAHPSLTLLQAREPAEIRLLSPAPEGLGLLGTPGRDARPSWLAPVVQAANPPGRGGNGNGNGNGDGNGDGNGGDRVPRIRGDMVITPGPGTPPGPVEKLPLWLQAAVRLGTRFLRVAAAGVPPASTRFTPHHEATGCCACCGQAHPPTVDEYYFWLEDSRSFDAVVQNADQGITAGDVPENTLTDWHHPEKLPGLLSWGSGPGVHLVWCRVHNGEFQPPRRSDEELRIDPGVLPPGTLPQLDFKGRTADSLRFEVSGGKTPVGYLDPTPPGFRYDLATDEAVVLPLVAAPPAPVTSGFPGGLPAYPFFAWFEPGAHLEPPSPFSVALT